MNLCDLQWQLTWNFQLLLNSIYFHVKWRPFWILSLGHLKTFSQNFFKFFFSIYIDILQLSYPRAFENIDFDFAACFTPPYCTVAFLVRDVILSSTFCRFLIASGIKHWSWKTAAGIASIIMCVNASISYMNQLIFTGAITIRRLLASK